MIVGIETIIAANKMGGTFCIVDPPSNDTAAITGRADSDFVNVIPNNKSLQIQVNWNKNTAASGARAIGM